MLPAKGKGYEPLFLGSQGSFTAKEYEEKIDSLEKLHLASVFNELKQKHESLIPMLSEIGISALPNVCLVPLLLLYTALPEDGKRCFLQRIFSPEAIERKYREIETLLLNINSWNNLLTQESFHAIQIHLSNPHFLSAALQKRAREINPFLPDRNEFLRKEKSSMKNNSDRHVYNLMYLSSLVDDVMKENPDKSATSGVYVSIADTESSTPSAHECEFKTTVSLKFDGSCSLKKLEHNEESWYRYSGINNSSNKQLSDKIKGAMSGDYLHIGSIEINVGMPKIVFLLLNDDDIPRYRNFDYKKNGIPVCIQRKLINENDQSKVIGFKCWSNSRSPCQFITLDALQAEIAHCFPDETINITHAINSYDVFSASDNASKFGPIAPYFLCITRLLQKAGCSELFPQLTHTTDWNSPTEYDAVLLIPRPLTDDSYQIERTLAAEETVGIYAHFDGIPLDDTILLKNKGSEFAANAKLTISSMTSYPHKSQSSFRFSYEDDDRGAVLGLPPTPQNMDAFIVDKIDTTIYALYMTKTINRYCPHLAQ